MKVPNYIMMESGKVIVLTLIDLCAAFDTVIHDIRNQGLRRDYGISDSLLNGLTPICMIAIKRWSLASVVLSDVALETGITQGSADGPEAYTRYTKS